MDKTGTDQQSSERHKIIGKQTKISIKTLDDGSGS
ncbi:predicted protein [Botrytis cinerea T4]|uniref:Uncharacterized protein n=1 Tax=Botryotinia fuckeliana (strain T4) TaxID=999810 RepID=G2XTA6_BOTF4|nr:predicted protein [Botrytis cinerea T4]